MSKLYMYVMRSRNEDNKNIQGFKERCRTIVEYEENEEKILAIFDDFVKEGVSGEDVKLYKSVDTWN